MEHIRILIVDDHPSQVEGYRAILSCSELDYTFETAARYDCESAYKTIIGENASDYFDVVFLDKNMPPFVEKNIHSGEDLVPVIKRYMPQTKVIVLTSYIEAFVLYNIVTKFQPHGLLVKSDFHPEELLIALDEILRGKQYHSQTVKASLNQLLSKKEFLDSYNRQIILLLSQGVKTKSMPEYLNISLSAIEKRKSQIKDYFCITTKGTDEDIVKEARRLGFIS